MRETELEELEQSAYLRGYRARQRLEGARLPWYLVAVLGMIVGAFIQYMVS